MSIAVRPRRQPSHAAVQANRAALLDAMRERCERGGAKTRPSFGDIMEREGVLSDAGRNAQREGRLRDHAALAAMGRSRHRAGRSRGPRAATAQKERLKRGATVVVPWDMRDQLDKSSEIVAAQVCVCVCVCVCACVSHLSLSRSLPRAPLIPPLGEQEAPGLGSRSRILVQGRLRSDGREWWAPQVEPDEAPRGEQLSTLVFGFHDVEERCARAAATLVLLLLISPCKT